MIVLFAVIHHFCCDLNATNNKQESQRNEMLSGYDYGNVSYYSCERAMDYEALDVFYLMALYVPMMMWSDHMFR